MWNLRFSSLVLTAIFVDFCMSQPNVLNDVNKWHAYIYVINHDLSFVHVFFNNHVTEPRKKATKNLVDNCSSVAQFGCFFICLE